MASKRLQPQRRWSVEKAAFSVNWCGAGREERDQMVSRVLGVFYGVFAALLSQQVAWRWCQLDASGALWRMSPPAFGAAAVCCAFLVHTDAKREEVWPGISTGEEKRKKKFLFSPSTFNLKRSIKAMQSYFLPLWAVHPTLFFYFMEKRDPERERFSKVRWFPGGLSDVHGNEEIS